MKFCSKPLFDNFKAATPVKGTIDDLVLYQTFWIM